MIRPHDCCFSLLLTLGTLSVAQQPSTVPGSSQQAPDRVPDPVLVKRPLSKATVVLPGEGRIGLDVVVMDGSGKPVSGLERKDFTLMDNGRAQAIVSFRASSLAAGGHPPEPPVAVLLVLDEANTDRGQMPILRASIEAFLRRHDGHLTAPIALFLLSDTGLKQQTAFSLDGKMLASVVHQLKPSLRTITAAQGAQGALERFQVSVRALSSIAENGNKLPGRKLIIWTGPGWPTLAGGESNYNARGHALNFNAILSLSAELRESRTEICSAGGGSEFFYQQFLKGVKLDRDANSGNLGLQILAVQSGGRTLDSANGSHLDSLINTCLADAGPFYTLTFDPPAAAHADEYHDLSVRLSKPGLKARTNTGYYDQP